MFIYNATTVPGHEKSHHVPSQILVIKAVTNNLRILFDVFQIRTSRIMLPFEQQNGRIVRLLLNLECFDFSKQRTFVNAEFFGCEETITIVLGDRAYNGVFFHIL